MCTLILDFEPSRDRPYLVAANRDELLTRPASGPKRWAGEPFVAPLDEQARGSWLGLNTHGLFVGITNRFGVVADPARDSRGTLVLEALREPTAFALHQLMGAVPPERFNAFHLLYTDGRHAFVTWSTGQVLEQQVLEPGLHIVTERSLGGDDHSRTELVRQRWPALERKDGLVTVPALHALLSTHGSAPGEGVCMHVPAYNFGTRSSLILYGAPEATRTRWWWADKSPCVSEHVERADLPASLA